MYKPSSLITVLKKGSKIPEEYSPTITVPGGIPRPVLPRYCKDRALFLSKAVSEYQKGACILWIENIVSESQEAYDYFCSKVKNDDVGLLHSRFTAWDRKDKEEKWTSRLGKNVDPLFRKANPCILVGTQVCEQSLDIDADVLYTSVCPMDMFIQRIGRTWRHRKFDSTRQVPDPTVNWFGWDGQSIKKTLDKIDTLGSLKNDLLLLKRDWKSFCVYDPYVLAKSIEVLSPYKQLSIPGDIRKLLEATYA